MTKTVSSISIFHPFRQYIFVTAGSHQPAQYLETRLHSFQLTRLAESAVSSNAPHTTAELNSFNHLVAKHSHQPALLSGPIPLTSDSKKRICICYCIQQQMCILFLNQTIKQSRDYFSSLTLLRCTGKITCPFVGVPFINSI